MSTSTNSARASGWRAWFRQVLASDAELDAQNLERASERIGCQHAGACRRGERARLSGRLASVTVSPASQAPTLEAELYDGTDTITLMWMGRRRIPGIEPGRSVIVVGRIAMNDDRKVLYNPQYTLEPAAS
ncbi:MAG: OB-fold nucleic acid binding domain-containing protein [Corynebacteriales bacterium]|nr:OB-fold nucleic acid binding domain-containing protein [Mycobacteriales bacterium]